MITYNAALNRPAYQSSLYTRETGPFTADRANDGSRHARYNRGTKCAVTNITANPWWAVDLSQPMTIYRVYLTTSIYSCKYCTNTCNYWHKMYFIYYPLEKGNFAPSKWSSSRACLYTVSISWYQSRQTTV